MTSFPTTDYQKEVLRQFCRDKIGSDSVISVSQTIGDGYILSLSVFENRPKVYMGILDIERKKILTDIRVTDNDLENALENLEYKYAFATTRKNPVANIELVTAWIDYINSDAPKEVVPL